MNKYIALTIGPIYRTMESCQRTRMVWGASFLFSYLIRELTKLLKEGGCTVIIPCPDKIECDTFKNGEGKYPDRILIQAKKGDFEKVQEAINALLKVLAEDIVGHLRNREPFKGNNKLTEKNVINDLKSYLQFYYIEKEINEGDNALLSLYDDLDDLELRTCFLQNDENNFLFYYLFYLSIKNKTYSKPAQAAFPDDKIDDFSIWKYGTWVLNSESGKYERIKRFPSLIEISTVSLAKLKFEEYNKLALKHIVEWEKHDPPNESPVEPQKNENDFQDEFILGLKEISQFKKFHQYFAVMYADGDNIGSTLRKIGGNNKELKIFSEKLLDFNNDLVEIITNYGGAPVYLGGEDIFAFVPLVSLNEKQEVYNIMDLVRKIDEKFAQKFSKEYAQTLGVVQPCLSFGIAINYYKNPLNLTIKRAHELLGKAKSRKEKNAIELELQEHTGQLFQLSVLKNNSESYRVMEELLKSLCSNVLKDEEDEEDKKFINSIVHRLREPAFSELLKLVAKDKYRLGEFFKQSFNEPIHRKKQEYITAVEELVKTIFTDYDDETSLQNIYAVLRLIDFMHKDIKD